MPCILFVSWYLKYFNNFIARPMNIPKPKPCRKTQKHMFYTKKREKDMKKIESNLQVILGSLNILRSIDGKEPKICLKWKDVIESSSPLHLQIIRIEHFPQFNIGTKRIPFIKTFIKGTIFFIDRFDCVSCGIWNSIDMTARKNLYYPRFAHTINSFDARVNDWLI